MSVLSICASVGAPAQTGTSLGAGLSAAATGSGGATVAAESGPLDAVQGNPAGLADADRPALELSALGLVAQGRFQNSADANGTTGNLAGAMLLAAYQFPLGRTPWRVAVAFTPDMLMRVRWNYIDPPGTAGVSYGRQLDESKILALRSSLSLARSLGPHWSAGVGIGLVYNANTLRAPYIFQIQPALAGLKVLLDLNTHGTGWNGNAGVRWQPSTRLRLGASWKSSTCLPTKGTATGDASALFAALNVAADSTYSYRAEVDNRLPQAAAVGFALLLPNHTTIQIQGDYTGWAGAFRDLPVALTDGTNAVINSVAGSASLNDEVPLHWHDGGAVHLGFDTPLTETFHLRAGYAFMSDPVPAATLTPLTAAILQHTLSAGAGTARGRWHYDIAYALQLPSTRTVGTSALQAGEYSNSRVRVMTQAVTFTARRSF